MKYYRVLADNSGFSNRWFLSEPLTADGEVIDSREFCYGQPYAGPPPAMVPIGQRGQRVAFNLAAFDMPVVTGEIATILGTICPCDIQRFPVRVGSDIPGYEIVNATNQEKCVDEVRSNVRKWGAEDERPDKIGHYREFNPLVIDPTRTSGRHIFRIWGSLVELIVSDEVKRHLEELPNLGIVFKPVSV